MSEYDFDLFVIGAGSGGVRLARMSASKGLKVAVAEDRYMGGTCVNVGCVPKKLFVYASHVQEELEDGEGFGWQHTGNLTHDWKRLVDNKNAEISRLNGIYEGLLSNSGAKVFLGKASLADAHTIKVGDETVTAEKIVIATGGWPNKLDIPGSEYIISSNEFFYLDALPDKALVLGGGYIGVELAGILSGLGVDVSLAFRGKQILRGFDDEVVTFVTEQIKNKGISLLPETSVLSVEKQGLIGSEYTVALNTGETLNAGLVLSAIGRSPKVQGLGLESVGVDLAPNGAVLVDEQFKSSVDNIYAVGDVIDRVQLTPVALAEGMYLSSLFAGENPEPVDYSNIATAVFCQPNIGTVGLTEQQAKDTYGDIDVYTSSFKPMKHTLSGRNERSLMKMIVDKATDKVVGIHMVGAEAGEIIQGMAVAMKAGATKKHFDSTIGIHPTAAEEFVTMRTPRA